MERPERNSPGFRPTDTVALSTVQRIDLYHRAKQHGWLFNLTGFLLLAMGGFFAGLLISGHMMTVASRPFFLILALGLAGTGMSLMWARRASWLWLAAIWLAAVLVGFLALMVMTA